MTAASSFLGASCPGGLKEGGVGRGGILRRVLSSPNRKTPTHRRRSWEELEAIGLKGSARTIDYNLFETL